MTTGLHWIDGVILFVYACGMIGVGWWYARRQMSTDEYFVGNRSMNPTLIGVSMYATLFSTISYLSMPGEVLNHGPVMPLSGFLAIPIYYCIVAYVIVPVYMKHRAISAYTLLETQLGLHARITGATLFILMRLMWMSVLIYLSSKALLVMLGMGQPWLPMVAFVTGSIAICYASMGGLRAVVITDLVQFLVLFCGALLVIAMVTWEASGLSWLPTQWNSAWDMQPLFDSDPTVRVTVFGSILNMVLWWVCTAGGDQTAIQRFMSTKDAAAARRSFLISSLAGAAVAVVLVLVGFALLAFYQADVLRLPVGRTIEDSADELFPYFVSHHLPIGLSGLVLCGLFAAAMSSVDSGINSITAVVMTDFVDRFRETPLSERARVRSARWLAFTIGLIIVSISSFFMDHVPGNYLEQAQRTFNPLAAPIFMLFLFALFIPFATQGGAIFAAVTGFIAAFIVAYWNRLTGLPMISFQWIFPVSLATGIVSGCALSLLSYKKCGKESDT